MAFTAEWTPDQNLWEVKKYRKYSEVDYVRTFLGHEKIFVPIQQVLIFETIPGKYRVNPFMKQAMDSIHYNHIEIITFDDGKRRSKKEYREILDQCGYTYIKKIVLASEFYRKKCDVCFFQKMVKKYCQQQENYGIISNYINIFAILKHLDFLLYVSPNQFSHRYYFGKRLPIEVQIFQKFVNEQLFNGVLKESRGYHFGYAFEGIFFYGLSKFLKEQKEQKKIHTIYFTLASSTACQAYFSLYPEDHVEILYIDQQTERNEELQKYLQKNVEDRGMIVDISLGNDLKEYLKKELKSKVCILNLQDYFEEKNLKKYGKDIERAVQMAKETNFFVKRYQNSLPIWEEEKTDIRTLRSRQEIQRGIIDFVNQFEECVEGYVDTYVYSKKFAPFTGKILSYAFDEAKRSKPHMEPIQAVTRSRAVKKIFRLAKRMYHFIKRRL